MRIVKCKFLLKSLVHEKAYIYFLNEGIEISSERFDLGNTVHEMGWSPAEYKSLTGTVIDDKGGNFIIHHFWSFLLTFALWRKRNKDCEMSIWCRWSGHSHYIWLRPIHPTCHIRKVEHDHPIKNRDSEALCLSIAFCVYDNSIGAQLFKQWLWS